METCRRCGAPLSMDETGLNRKLINRGVETFLCIRCLAAEFKTTEEALRAQADRFRAAGCSMFPPKRREGRADGAGA